MYLGIDIGGTKCAVTLGDENGIRDKIRFATSGVSETLDDIVKSAKKLMDHDVRACGISCGGPLDEKKGIILSPPNLPGWDEIHMTELLERELSVPCKLCNDANACALAEYYFGAGRGTQSMVFMTFGTGLGAGLILNGKLYSGANGFAGELGHIRLDAFGPSGYGKCGSFEGFCSGGGISELARSYAREASQRGEAPEWQDACGDVKTVADAARNGDKIAQRVFDICGRKLGEGLAIVIDLLNPEKIIIGSVFARCRDLIEKPMYKVLEREALAPALSACEITAPGLGEEIGDYAALAAARTV